MKLNWSFSFHCWIKLLQIFHIYRQWTSTAAECFE